MQSRTPTSSLSESVQAVRTSLRRSGSILLLLALFLVMAPAALAHNIWYVDGVNGSDGNDCKSSVTACKTIGHAISLASSGDSIMVAPATYSENLTINLSLRIIGSGAATTIVDGGGVATVFTIPGTATHVLLSELTIRNGSSQSYAGGIWNGGTLTVNRCTITANSANFSGGGIINWATLTVNRCTITANSASGGGGVWQGSSGVGKPPALTINNSTLSGNSATFGFGGGIDVVAGTLTINNSTLSGNSGYYGGGIENDGTLTTINNSTLSGNSGPEGGGIFSNGGLVTLQNSIIANNSGGNCSGPMTSNGYNLSSDDTCNFSGPGDLNNTNPRLQPLGNYGGPTQTMALPGNSPAIDAGNPGGCTDSNGNLLKTDQRGAPRPGPYDDHGCDMGAFENQRH